ncbi:hypothetical protein TRVL_07104 [Trypanosoma vivax]|nr:hypothetical protein TRVL_07104 [Trypanosoma vivax]
MSLLQSSNIYAAARDHLRDGECTRDNGELCEQTLQCNRCLDNFKLGRQGIYDRNTCWRCGYPICHSCRRPWRRRKVLWACNVCVKGFSFMRFFQMTVYGVDVLVRVMEFCDTHTVSLLKLLFPLMMLREVELRERTSLGRGRDYQEITSEPSLSRRPLSRTSTAAAGIVASVADVKETLHLSVEGAPERRSPVAQQVSAVERSPSPVKRNSTSCLPSAHRSRSISPAMIAAQDKQDTVPVSKAVAGTSKPLNGHSREMSSNGPEAQKGNKGNQFLRCDAAIQSTELLVYTYSGGTNFSAGSESFTRGDSPLPRFPSFSKYLDEQQSVRNHREQWTGEECEQGHRYTELGDKGAVKRRSGVEVVELGTRAANNNKNSNKSAISPRALMSNNHTAFSKACKVVYTSGPARCVTNARSPNKRRLYKAAPQAHTDVPATASNLRTAPRSLTRASGGRRPSPTVSMGTAKSTKNKAGNGEVGSLPSKVMSLRKARGVLDANHGNKLRTTSPATARTNSATPLSTPRASAPVVGASLNKNKTTMNNALRPLSSHVTTTTPGAADDDSVQRNTWSATGVAGARGSTTLSGTPFDKAIVSSLHPPIVAGPKMSSTIRARSAKKMTPPIAARVASVQRTTDDDRKAVATSNPPQYVVMPTTPSRLRTRNTADVKSPTVARSTGTRTPLKRIQSSRIMPTQDGTSRYLPSQMDTQFTPRKTTHRKQALSTSSVMLHITRKSVEDSPSISRSARVGRTADSVKRTTSSRPRLVPRTFTR